MKMKKIVSLLMILTLAASLFGCVGYKNEEKTETDAEKTTVRIAVLSGPTGMGIAKLFVDNLENKCRNAYEINIYSDPTEVIAAVRTGKCDAAAVPTNVAAKLDAMPDVEITAAALNTLGVLYVLENGDSVKTVADLKGKTIYANGQGANPQYALEYVLEQNGLVPGKDVTIVYEPDADAVVADLNNGKASIVMLPEPKVSVVLTQIGGLRVALDITQEWDKVSAHTLAQGCVVVTKAFANAHKEAFDLFLSEYEASIDFVNANPEEAAEMIVRTGIIGKAPIAKKAIPGCGLVFIDGEEMKNVLNGMYDVLFAKDPASIGGRIPEDSFYYER